MLHRPRAAVQLEESKPVLLSHHQLGSSVMYEVNPEKTTSERCDLSPVDFSSVDLPDHTRASTCTPSF